MDTRPPRKQQLNISLISQTIVTLALIAIASIGLVLFLGARTTQPSLIARQPAHVPLTAVSFQPTEIPEPTTTIAQPIPVSAEELAKLTAGWKRYENTEEGFSFKYPSTWYLTGSSGKGGTTSLSTYDPFNAPPHGFLTSKELKASLSWEWYERSADQTLERWAENAIVSIGSARILSSYSVRIGDRQVLKAIIEGTVGMGKGDSVVHYYLPHGRWVLRVDASPIDSIHLASFELVLATLQFTN